MMFWPHWRGVRCKRILTLAAAGWLLATALLPGTPMRAAPAETTDYRRLQELYDHIAFLTGLTWQSVAAIDRYETMLSRTHPKTRPLSERTTVGIYISPERWAGYLNPDQSDQNPSSIRVFGGIGLDGSGDGLADRENDIDLLYTVTHLVRIGGSTGDDFAIGLWDYYQNTRAVQRILQFEKIYSAFNKLDLSQHVFPLPLGSVYAYRSTWGNSRGWGGARIHEGTDIFARHGVPVRSTTYGIVEVKGWNPFGGWRVGIRDLDNLYHYYAHLSGFQKNLKVGSIVKPGQTIGWVGNSGYGKPGTSGKFPPHLHYGVYRDRGLVEWAFDPYPMLRRWERAEHRSLRAHKD